MGKQTASPPSTVPEFTAGDRLRKARELLGLDQESFADKLGVSRGTVSNYERNATTNRRPIVLRTWALATGVSLDWLEQRLDDADIDVVDEDGQPA